jgi:hypothetical protein
MPSSVVNFLQQRAWLRRGRDLLLRPTGPKAIGCYVLTAAGEPAVAASMLAWAQWMATANRHVEETMVGGARVSTVFTGIDGRPFPSVTGMKGLGPSAPWLWETMVFGGVLHGTQRRYPSVAEARLGHTALVAAVVAALDTGAVG